MKYGIQLCSVQDALNIDAREGLCAVAEMGFTYAETAGFAGHEPEEFAKMAREAGLTICSTHTGYGEVFNDTENVIAYHKAIGCSDLVIPWACIWEKDSFDEFVKNINRVMPIYKKEGIRLHYHNHAPEFSVDYGGKNAIDALMEATDMMFEPDIFWISDAGLDPVAMIEKYKNRIAFVHLKDGIFENSEHGPIHKAIGHGEAPIEAVLKKACELGMQVIVESEGREPSGLAEVQVGVDYLKSIGWYK